MDDGNENNTNYVQVHRLYSLWLPNGHRRIHEKIKKIFNFVSLYRDEAQLRDTKIIIIFFSLQSYEFKSKAYKLTNEIVADDAPVKLYSVLCVYTTRYAYTCSTLYRNVETYISLFFWYLGSW